MSSDYKRHKNYSKYLPNIKTVAVYGGSSINDQIRSLREKPQIIVGTPGRVIDLINRKSLIFPIFTGWY